jgi:tight adherence protein B
VEIAILVFALFVAIVWGLYWILIVRPEDQAERAVRRRLTERKAHALATTLLRARQTVGAVPFVDALVTRLSGTLQPLQRLIDRAGGRTTVRTVVLVSIAAASAMLLIVMVVTDSVLASVALAIGVAFVPVIYLRIAAKKRMAAFEEQFPEAVDFIARALRAGHTMPTALQLVSEEMPNPVGGEFGLLADQQNYGMPMPDALRAFAARVPLVDARFFATAVLTQREMGGNLSEVLDNLSSVIRERFKVKRQVRSVSAHGRITAVVLGCMPPVIAAVLFVLSPQHMGLLFRDPLGINMLLGGLVLQAIGILWIRRVVEVEY